MAPAGWHAQDVLRAVRLGVFARTPEGEISGVRLGALDGDPGIRPSIQQFVDYAAPWEPMPDDGLPRHPERAPA